MIDARIDKETVSKFEFSGTVSTLAAELTSLIRGMYNSIIADDDEDRTGSEAFKRYVELGCQMAFWSDEELASRISDIDRELAQLRGIIDPDATDEDIRFAEWFRDMFDGDDDD